MRKSSFRFIAATFLILLLMTMVPRASHARDDFSAWLEELRAEALSMGISASTLEQSLSGLRPLERVVELDRNQPEFKKDFSTYLELMVNKTRINKGRRLMREHSDLLNAIKEKYGVQPRFLVAIWGLESNFGKHTGTFPVIDAVATLAYDARRSSFFRKQLLSSLRILDEGHIALSDMKGSWAGAMGQLQFMPSTFIHFAVDEDSDGRKDIWKTLPDIFASAANFLSSYGWDDDYTWGREVIVPPGLDSSFYGLDSVKYLSEWQKLGVRRLNGDDLPDADIKASLIKPDENSPAFIVYNNYRAIMKWNRSHLYALAVCRLSDTLR